MVRAPIISAVSLVAVVAACGGGGDREAFVRDANKACRDLRREFSAIPELAPLSESVKVYERELRRLQQVDPPDDVRDRYDRMLRYKKDGLDAWREFTRYAQRNDSKGGAPASTRATQSLVRAAQLGSQLHLQDCDRALS
jgi:hypothetical protein